MNKISTVESFTTHIDESAHLLTLLEAASKYCVCHRPKVQRLFLPRLVVVTYPGGTICLSLQLAACERNRNCCS